MKHSHSGSRSRRRRYHGNNQNHPNHTPNTSHRRLQDSKSPPHSPQSQDHHSFTAYDFNDCDTFSPLFIPSSSAPSLFTRTLNRIRLVLGTLLLIPALLLIAPYELLDFDDFLFHFKKGTLP